MEFFQLLETDIFIFEIFEIFGVLHHCLLYSKSEMLDCIRIEQRLQRFGFGVFS